MEKITRCQILPASAEPGNEITAQRRCHDLQRLLAVWPHEIADVSLPGRRRTVRWLERALRQERNRARAGHWAYDVSRHQQLARHLRAEQAALKSQELSERQQQPRSCVKQE